MNVPRPTAHRDGAVTVFLPPGMRVAVAAGVEELGWCPPCGCAIAERVPAVVLDRFARAQHYPGRAASLGRQAIGVELSPDCLELIRQRCADVAST